MCAVTASKAADLTAAACGPRAGSEAEAASRMDIVGLGMECGGRGREGRMERRDGKGGSGGSGAVGGMCGEGMEAEAREERGGAAGAGAEAEIRRTSWRDWARRGQPSTDPA